MAQTKAQRQAAARKGMQTRMRNAEEKQKDPHAVDHGQDSRTTEQDVMQSYGVSRDANEEAWKPPAELDTPKPQKGFTQRWIRITLGEREDAKNSIKKFREGWLPRKLETVPEGYVPPTFSHSQLGDVIGVDDLILCEMPIKKALQRNAYYQARIDRMVEGIENDLRNVSSGGPRIAKDHKTRVTKHRRRVPADPTEA